MIPRIQKGVIWLGFAGALVLATAPVWRLWVFGFSPTVDEFLQLAICGGPLTR
jgi:hypothetical protein